MRYRGRDLDGRAALVTEANRGRGPHFAQVLAEAGARVGEAAHAADNSAPHLARLGTDPSALMMDITDLASLGAALTEMVRRLGRLDILVNNDGILFAEPFLDDDDAE